MPYFSWRPSEPTPVGLGEPDLGEVRLRWPSGVPGGQRIGVHRPAVAKCVANGRSPGSVLTDPPT